MATRTSTGLRTVPYGQVPEPKVPITTKTAVGTEEATDGTLRVAYVAVQAQAGGVTSSVDARPSYALPNVDLGALEVRPVPDLGASNRQGSLRTPDHLQAVILLELASAGLLAVGCRTSRAKTSSSTTGATIAASKGSCRGHLAGEGLTTAIPLVRLVLEADLARRSRVARTLALAKRVATKLRQTDGQLVMRGLEEATSVDDLGAQAARAVADLRPSRAPCPEGTGRVEAKVVGTATTVPLGTAIRAVVRQDPPVASSGLPLGTPLVEGGS